MIEGWEKGLLNMCVGEKRKLVVPSDMVSLFVYGLAIYESKQASDGISLPLIVFCLFCLDDVQAYGAVGGFGSESRNKIKPNVTLVYNIELLQILDEDEAEAHMIWGLQTLDMSMSNDF